MESKIRHLWIQGSAALLWMILAVSGIMHHEMWLDEAHHWLLAQESDSVKELFLNMRYEGHPPLWNLSLFVISRMSDSPFAMQMLNLVFASGCMLLLLFYSPFPWWVRLLLPFTYFFGYEYTVISRNYSSAVFFLLLACVLLKNIPKNYLWIAVCLGTAVLFHAYAGVVGGFVLLYCAIGLWKKKEIKPLVVAVCVFAVLALISAWNISPPADHFLFSRFGNDTFAVNHLGTVVSMPFVSLLHFPDLVGGNWWNGNLFLPGHLWFKGLMVSVFWLLFTLVFVRNRKIFLLYISAALVLSVVYLFTPMVLAVRHSGFFLVLFLVCYWLMSLENGSTTRWQRVVSGGILFLQVISFSVAMVLDLNREFSSAKSTAEWIRSNHPETQVTVFPQCNGPAVSLYLGHEVFYAEKRSMGSFVDWKEDRFLITAEEMKMECRKYMVDHHLDSMLVVTGYDDFFLGPAADEMQLLAVFDEGVVQAEHYSIYLLKP